MGIQTGTSIDTEILSSKSDLIFTTLANNQTVKERFDIGDGASIEDYISTKYLKRVLLSEDLEIVEKQDQIKSKLNHIKNRYL